MQKTLNKDLILKQDDLQLKGVDVPEWGGHIYVRGLTGTERAKWESYVVSVTKNGKPKPNANLRESVLIYALCDASGKRLFKDEDAHLLAEKNGAVIEKLFKIAADLSGLNDEDIEAAEKN